MQNALASGTLVALSLTAVVALGQAVPPRAPTAAPAPSPAAPTPTAPASSALPPRAPGAAPTPTPAGSASAAATSAAPTPAPAPAPTPVAPTPTPPAAETAPPTSPAAPSPPPIVGSASPTPAGPAAAPVDRGAKVEKKKTEPDPWQDGHAVGAEGAVYVSGRLGPSSIDPAEEERAGLGFDLSAWYTLSREYVLGFGLTHADLGSVSTTAGIDSFEGEYGVTAAYLGARAFPWRSANSEVFIGLRVGLAWQDVDARGWRTFQPNVSQPEPFTCSGVSGPALALGAGIGAAFRLGANAWLTGRLDANGYKMSSDVVENCAVGLGSATNATLGAGLLYAFDLGEDAELSSKAPTGRQTW